VTVLLVYDCPLPRLERQALLDGLLHVTKVMCRDSAAKGQPADWNKALAVITASGVGESIDRPHLGEGARAGPE
jgi:hypothetical protein